MIDQQMDAEQQIPLDEATMSDIGGISDVTSISEASALCLQMHIAEITTTIFMPRGLGLFDLSKLVACWNFELFVLDSLLAQIAG